MGQTGLHPQAYSSERPTKICLKNITKFCLLNVYQMAKNAPKYAFRDPKIKKKSGRDSPTQFPPSMEKGQ